jgi:hypothetical protein
MAFAMDASESILRDSLAYSVIDKKYPTKLWMMLSRQPFISSTPQQEPRNHAFTVCPCSTISPSRNCAAIVVLRCFFHTTNWRDQRRMNTSRKVATITTRSSVTQSIARLGHSWEILCSRARELLNDRKNMRARSESTDASESAADPASSTFIMVCIIAYHVVVTNILIAAFDSFLKGHNRWSRDVLRAGTSYASNGSIRRYSGCRLSLATAASASGLPFSNDCQSECQSTSPIINTRRTSSIACEVVRWDNTSVEIMMFIGQEPSEESPE